MPLTDVAVRNAKPDLKPRKMGDAGGLFLLVTPAGGKLWKQKYRWLGNEQQLALGSYPTVTLAEARELRDANKKLLASGLNPAEAKKQNAQKIAEAEAQTFGVVASQLLAKQAAEGKADATLTKNRWLLEDLAKPLTDRPIAQIAAPEILNVLRRVEARGARESAVRLRSAIGRVFRYAIATGQAEADPTAALAGALQTPRVQHRAALIDPEQVGQLLRAIDGLDGTAVVKDALRIMALCFPRPGELRHAEWTEIDLERAVWHVPAERTKMRRPHRIPLAPQAVAILTELRAFTGRGRYVFPGLLRAAVPISENTLNAALRRLGYTADEMTAHGFRTTASTLLNESRQWHPDAIERALAHQDGNAVRRAYNRGDYWDERVRMAEWWANHLDELKARSRRAEAA